MSRSNAKLTLLYGFVFFSRMLNFTCGKIIVTLQMGEQLEKNILVLSNFQKYRMAATENEPEIIILSLIDL